MALQTGEAGEAGNESSMELRHLKYFIVLAEELHFGRAAQRLHITQPPLSFNLQKLEEYLGVQLLIRDSRNVRLTVAGEAFLAEARRVLMQAQHAEETAREVDHGHLGKLQLGFTSSMLYRGMPEILEDFARRYPHVSYELIDTTIAEQAEAIRQGRIHGGFVPALAMPPGLTGLPLADDTYVCCVPADHWAAGVDVIPLSRLADETFILFGRETTVSGHEYVLSLCIGAGFHPKVRAYVRQWLTGLAMISKGFGIALMPASLQAAKFEGVRFVPLTEVNPVGSFFVWDAGKVSPALKTLIRCLHERRSDG